MEGDDEHPSSSLGHSEVASVENPVGPPVPEFPQAIEERRKVAASMRGEESRYILEEDGGRSVSLHKVEEGEGEAAAGSGESGPLASDGEVLTGEAAGPEGCWWNSVYSLQFPLDTSGIAWSYAVIVARPSKRGDVTEVRDSGPSLGEDGVGVGVDLREGDGAPAGTFKPKVD